MRSILLIGVLAFLSASANAYTDFTALAGQPARAETADNHVRLSHAVHHQFHDTGAHYKLNYEAEHHKNLHFVELHNHVDDFSSAVLCEKTEAALHVRNPSASLLAAVHHQGLKDTIITAHPRFHCKGKQILRHLEDAQMDQATNTLTLKTRAARLNTIFRNLKLSMETNHVHSKDDTVVEAHNTVDSTEIAKGRGFSTQWGFHHFFHSVDRCVHHVAHVVKHVASDAGKVVKKVATDVKDVASVLVTGDYSHDFDYAIHGIAYNGNAAKHYSKDQIVTAGATGACSMSFVPSVHLDVDIEHFHPKSIQSYLEGVLTVAVNGQFQATLNYQLSKNEQVADIQLSTITFSIGPVPIVIHSHVPVRAGFTVDIDGQLDAQAVITANGQAKFGYGYTDADGFQAIRTHSFSYTKDFKPMDYSLDIGVSVFVEPSLVVSIDSILDFSVVVSVDSHLELESNDQCLAYVSVTAQPTISLSAGVDVDLFHHKMLDKNWGPKVLYTHLFPLYSYCKPQDSWMQKHLGASRAMTVQETTEANNRLSPLRDHTLNSGSVVTTTTPTAHGFVGLTWSSQNVRCPLNGYIKEDISAMYADGWTNGSSVLIVVITKSFELVPSSRGYQSHLIQGVYTMDGPLTHTTGRTMTLVKDQNATFISSTNDTTHPVSIADTIYVAGGGSGSMNTITITSSNLCAGSMTLNSPQMNNDNSTFFTFAAGYPKAGATTNGANSATTASPVFYALIAVSTVAVLAIVALIVVSARAGRRSSLEDNAKEVEESMVANAAETPAQQQE